MGPRGQQDVVSLRRCTVGLGLSVVSPLSSPKSLMSGLIPDFTGQGFIAVDGTGQAFAYGDAPYDGDVTTAVPG
jgi:hypothetical protein